MGAPQGGGGGVGVNYPGQANTWSALQTFSAAITGTGTTGTLTAGTGILGTANTFTATQTFPAASIPNSALATPGAALSVANTWTAAQTFVSSALFLNNPGNTFAYVFVGSALAASHTITLPLLTANDTLAVLGLAQTFTATQTISTGSSSNGLDIVNTSTGIGSYINNGSTGIGSYINNSSTGMGSYINNGSTGNGSRIDNVSTGIGSYIANTSTGIGSLIQNTSTGLGIGINPNSTITGLTNPALTTGYGTTSVSTIYFNLTIGGVVTYFNGNATVNNGLFSELATTGTTAVALGTASTAIKSYTPTIANLYRVTVGCVSSAAAQTATITVTYLDVTLDVSVTQTQTGTIGLDAGETFIFSCLANPGAAITVAGTGTTASDVFATATIEAA